MDEARLRAVRVADEVGDLDAECLEVHADPQRTTITPRCHGEAHECG